MRHIPPRLQRAGTAISVCLFRPTAFLYLCSCWLAMFPNVSDGQTLSMTHPNELLTLDPDAFVHRLDIARPTPVSAEEKARILASLPLDGEVTDLKAPDLTKLAHLRRVFQTMDRESVYVVKVIDVPQAAIGLHGRAVVLISEAALALLNTDELQALAAHEIGHEYVWDEYARAISLGDGNRVKELELMCDAIAIVTLNRLRLDSSRLISGIEKISRFNHGRLGTAINERDYPTVAERRTFAQRVRAWLASGAAK